MKKLRYIACMILIVFVILSFTGCASSFFSSGSSDGLYISAVESENMDDGRIKITVRYTDKKKSPDVFFIPKGEDGKAGTDGTGIKDVTYSYDEVNKQTLINITYTDENKESVSFVIPDGLSITSLEEFYDEMTKSTYVIFNYNNGESKRIQLPDGVAGNGIVSYEVVPQDDGSIDLVFGFTDSAPFTAKIPAPKTGNGISSILGREEGGLYLIDITMTDGSTHNLELTRPTDPKEWHQGSGMPNMDTGKDGDFCFDTYHKKIYAKENGVWFEVVDFGSAIDQFKVTFNLNDQDDGGVDARMPNGTKTVYTINRGSYFASSGYDIPLPERDGYEFIGWYTKKSVDATMGVFTDLTPIASDLTLYAIWKPVA